MRSALGAVSSVGFDVCSRDADCGPDNRKCLDQETLTELDDRRTEMIRTGFLAAMVLVLLFGSAARSEAQVRQVEMHIDGYLCGN